MATGYILPDALAHNPPFHIQPVVQCLGRKLSDGYIETNDNKTNPPPVSATGTTTGAGGNNAQNGDDSRAQGQYYQVHLGIFGAVIIGFVGLTAGLLSYSGRFL